MSASDEARGRGGHWQVFGSDDFLDDWRDAVVVARNRGRLVV